MKVIAISGVSGCGKTSLIKELSASLSCPYLLFDDFIEPSSYPINMERWFEHGADVCQIKTPNFLEAIELELYREQASYLFIEEPFGRQRPEIADIIDQVILLDIPMELCLARVITRQIKNNRDALKNINNYLKMYQEYFRDIYISVNSKTQKHADLIITEVQPLKDLSKFVDKYLNNTCVQNNVKPLTQY